MQQIDFIACLYKLQYLTLDTIKLWNVRTHIVIYFNIIEIKVIQINKYLKIVFHFFATKTYGLSSVNVTVTLWLVVIKMC